MAFSQSLFADSILNLPGDLAREVMDELRRGFRAQEFLAEQEQRQIAQEQGEHHTVDGLGQKVLSVTPFAFHYWGQRLGYKCWKDPQFRREFARDNPEARVRYAPRNCSLRMQGLRNAERGVRNDKAAGQTSGLVLTNRFGK